MFGSPGYLKIKRCCASTKCETDHVAHKYMQLHAMMQLDNNDTRTSLCRFICDKLICGRDT